MKNHKLRRIHYISMIEFLTDYVGLEETLNDEHIGKLQHATHKDIKEIGFPYVKAVPMDSITDEEVLSGDIILVADGKSTDKNPRLAPYIRPQLLKERENKKGSVRK